MRNINIKSQLGDYNVIFKDNFGFLKDYNDGFFIIDKVVLKHYKKELYAKRIIAVKADESVKTLDLAGNIYSELLSKDFRKNDRIIAIGGGMVQDIAGFVSSTIFRGVKWIYIPTTLLSQTDSCIGGKTSLNIENFKNIIGTIYPPKNVFIINKFLKTLEKNDIKSGVGEMVKLLILGWEKNTQEDLVKLINNYEKSNFNFKPYIHKTLTIKKYYIENDERDTGTRNLLNYGHTFGHALESESKFNIPHGIAISYGMIFANIIANNRNLMEKNTFHFLNKRILTTFVKSRKSFDLIKLSNLINFCKKDKKVINNNLSFVLPKGRLNFIKVNDITQNEFKNAFHTFIKSI
jgi:3-dehydroquinate synthase